MSTGEDTITTEPQGPPKVTIHGQEITLVPPASFAIRSEIASAGASNFQRASAAALAACWRGAKSLRPQTSYRACSYNVLVFGAKVIDELVGAGVDYWEIMTAGALAYSLCAECLVSGEEVASIEAGFQGPAVD